MLEACSSPTDVLQDTAAADSVQTMRDLIERMQAELKFNQIKIEALNFEIARLKRWRFGASSESLESNTVRSRRNPATRSRHIPATWGGAEGRLEAPC